MFYVAQNFNNLVALLAHVNDGFGIQDESVIAVLKQCKKLKRLFVSRCHQLTAAVFDHMTSLTKLCISDSEDITVEDVVNAIEAGKFRDMSVLALSGCPLASPQYIQMALSFTSIPCRLTVVQSKEVQVFLQ